MNAIAGVGLKGCMHGARRTAAIVIAGVSLAFGSIASAEPILTNGGFEDLDFTGWMVDDSQGMSLVDCPGPGPSVAEGDCAAFLSTASGSFVTLSQTFATMPGVQYAIAFRYLLDGQTPADLSAVVNGHQFFSLMDPPATSGFASAFGRFIATGATSTLAFTFHDDPGVITLDAVVVALPEPASLLLVGLGLAGIGVARRRQRA